MSRIENLSMIIEMQNEKIYEYNIVIVVLFLLLCVALLGILLLILFRNPNINQD